MDLTESKSSSLRWAIEELSKQKDELKSKLKIAHKIEEGSSSIDIYQEDILKNYKQYHDIKKRYYQEEKRWPRAVFWQRRN